MKEKGNREGRKQKKIAGSVDAKDHLEEGAYICVHAYVHVSMYVCMCDVWACILYMHMCLCISVCMRVLECAYV